MRDWLVVVSRGAGGGRVLQHHPSDQADQGEDPGEGLKGHTGRRRSPPWTHFVTRTVAHFVTRKDVQNRAEKEAC